VGIEADLGVAAPRRFLLGKGEQPPAEAGALMRRSDRDIVEQQMVRPWQQYDNAGRGGACLV
jgi:hypothetical protein